MITIQLINKEMSEEILQFELENRKFFSKVMGDFGDEYYNLDYMNQLLREIEEDHSKDNRHMYIIRDEENKMVGRVNLYSIVRGPLNKAEIGYRISEKHNGKKYATKAVHLMIKEAFEVYNFHRLEASTSPKNIGSQVVLIKNHFQFVGKTSKFIKVGDHWLDSIHFSLLKEEYRA
ncbi:GNAT family N-acetyltransferase [Bacillus sp. BGMRC 2118]|nr:GNAT family N-acetyltransferase [Bacillus sp. BGMRC 2118]